MEPRIPDVDRSSDTIASADELSTNALFRLLRDSHRRATLRYLLERREAVSLDELAAWVASRRDAPSDQRLVRVAIDLHHVHLPKLADAGVVRYDPESETVEPLALPDGVEALLDSLANGDGGSPANAG